jgi:dihydrofolate reductase
MSKLVVTTYLTLDGVMQAPGTPDEDRRGGFAHGGWLEPYFDDELRCLVADWISRAEAFLLGRRTYELFAAHWPRFPDPLDPIAYQLNSRPKYVASRTLSRVDWEDTTLLGGDVAEEVAKLKAQPGREIQVQGSGDLVRTLMRHGLVDEYRLWQFPVVLGTGRRLFDGGAVPAAFRPVGTVTTGSGVVVHRYEPAGEVAHGSFALE